MKMMPLVKLICALVALAFCAIALVAEILSRWSG
jgi:hypothetical protein